MFFEMNGPFSSHTYVSHGVPWGPLGPMGPMGPMGPGALGMLDILKIQNLNEKSVFWHHSPFFPLSINKKIVIIPEFHAESESGIKMDVY